MNVTVGPELVANQAHRGLVPGFGGRISAGLVWDGTNEVRVPEAMGKPRADQMQGTPRERITELAGRCCYDSLGKGRSSADYAKHLIQVGHLSVLEHAAFTVQLEMHSDRDFVDFLNRPGVWVDHRETKTYVTLNLRAAMEWDKWLPAHSSGSNLGAHLKWEAFKLAPNLVGEQKQPGKPWRACCVVEPETDAEKWVTLYLVGSRGWSHELVRHGDWTAISQRSTRYVDESESQWVMHPLIAKFMEDLTSRGGGFAEQSWHCSEILEDCIKKGRSGYVWLVSKIQPWLESRGVDKVSARKQARGAARGLLGNALETEVIFSASVQQWKHMLRMRAADAADAEIRLQFAEAVLPCLKASRYADSFDGIELVPASDGLGRSLAGGGAK